MPHDHHVVRALLTAAYFLAGTDGSTLEADIAVDQLERIAAELQRMDGAARRELAAQLEELAAAEPDRQLAAFMREFSDDFGLLA
jgi:hypothetical protein